VFQVARGQAIGNAAENFWNAYGAQRILGRNEIAAGFALLGIFQFLRGELLGSASSLLFYSLKRVSSRPWNPRRDVPGSRSKLAGIPRD
jgi:hypothetical protein